jgi:anti-sigma B factor antagonist
MNFTVAKQGETVVIGIDGQLVVSNRLGFRELVLDALDRGERRFRVDFSRTRYVDSAGLGVLVAMTKKVAEERGLLTLANLDDDLKILFELTKLDTLFRYEPGDGAVERDAGGPGSILPPGFRTVRDGPESAQSR